MKKIYIAIAIFTVITMLTSLVYAATTETFEVVDDQVCTIKINDYCNFEKKLTSYDLNKRQVTIQLKITNDSIINKPTGEVMLVLDNSGSMNEPIETGSSTTRGSVLFPAAKNLVTKMLTGNDNLKVGVVSFSTNVDPSKWGSTEDACLVSELSNNVSEINTAIDNIEKNGSLTDLESGLAIASEHFSNSNSNKYVVVLTDGLPNVALDYTGLPFSEDVVNKTKSRLQSLGNKYSLVVMLTGISNPDARVTYASDGSEITYNQYIESVFGTTTSSASPSYKGKFYYISDSQIEKTIQEDIYGDLLPQSQSITDIKVTDFFPQEIVDNFDFAYVSQPTKGTISQSIDNDNKIVWSLDSLASGETATVQYTLTLKNNYDTNIVNRILDTNEKVDITYKDFDGKDKVKTSEDTPKVRINIPLKGKDPSTVPTIIPKAGKFTLISVAILLIVWAGTSGAKIFKIRHDIKKQD